MVGIWLMAGSPAMSQSAWSFLTEPARQVRITDVLEVDNGVLLSISTYNIDSLPSKRSFISKLDVFGDLTGTSRIWNDDDATSIWSLQKDWNGSGYMALGDLWSSVGDSGFHSLRFTSDLVHLDSTIYRCQALTQPFLDNSIRLDNGEVIIAGVGYGTSGFPVSAMQLIRIDQHGDSLDSWRVDNPGFLVARDVIEFKPDSFMVSAFGVPLGSPIQSGIASYSKFNTDLDLVGGFAGGTLDGSDDPLTFTNNISDHLHLSLLPSSNLIVSGRRGSGSSFRMAVQKITASGAWLAAFTPQSEFPLDYPAALRSSVLVGNELLVASMENYFYGIEVGTPFQPDMPNRIRIHKLDTALNLLCTNVLDGFAENAYYWLDRIKATSDGGYILCGGRVDLNAPTFEFAGWAQKFGPDDCFTGFDELAGGQEAVVYPNPGTDQFTLNLNGAMRDAQVVLFSVTGQAVASGWLRNGSVTISTAELLPGVYAYRVIDRAGTERASGRWVKTE